MPVALLIPTLRPVDDTDDQQHDGDLDEDAHDRGQRGSRIAVELVRRRQTDAG